MESLNYLHKNTMSLLMKIEEYLELVHVTVKKILKYVRKRVFKNSQP
jgi:hypothetical protein